MEFKDGLIHDYLKCNRHNAITNEIKATKIKYSHYLFLGGLINRVIIYNHLSPQLH